ncbi:hypothetical protein B1813_00880 [Saccharomonospora piscinae]|uniref:FAD-binding domain-containing protein n=1 Tax=Saccharomonospora piscinae TaxID=687388 RepID=A0A1V9AC87_SACPI|nr:FAD-dependent monooxygenase [Saccharomonospora piscinae]OQO94691.1 hypothetical protein B1813_00880 [Saccharomonospora piscinae]
MVERNAIVVGAGIGGLAAARALSRVGWSVRLFDQAAAFREVGAGLSMAPNAVRAMEWLGLGTELRAKAQGQGIGVQRARGGWLVQLREADLIERYGNPMFAMHRADLHRILFDAADAVDIHAGHRATALDTDSDGARVTFETSEGAVSLEADLVVAADGVHSTLRSMLFPGHPGATYADYVCWRGVAPPGAGSGLADPPVWTDSWGRGVRFGTAPLVDGRVFWYGSAAGPEGAFANDTLDDVATRFHGWHDPIPEVIAATDPKALLRNDIYYVADPLPSFVSGRVVLLGDAAHAVTPDIGQGACLAIEDAVVLGIALAGAEEPDSALRAYDAARRPRTQKLAQISGRSARVQQTRNPVGAGLRDLLIRLMPARAYLNAGAETLAWSPPDGAIAAP